MQIFLHSKSLYDIFSDLHGKDSKTLICNISWKLKKTNKQTCLPALKNFPMLGETNNQFYMANMNIEFAVLVKCPQIVDLYINLYLKI